MSRINLKACLISTYPPTNCGIATFSYSLVSACEKTHLSKQIEIIPVKNAQDKKSSKCHIIKDDIKSYYAVANYINNSQNIDVVILQHEYGIFGGENGEHIIAFLERLNKPVVMTMHSVLGVSDANIHRRNLTKNLLSLCDFVVVMTKQAKKLLVEGFKIRSDKVKIVYHGVPNIRFNEKILAKESLGIAKDKKTIMTFGLINRGKGIEKSISALAEVKKHFDNFIYYIIGATHPNIIKNEGESYRHELKALIKEKKLEKNVVFINKFLTYSELVDYLRATDIYLGPQNDLNQAVSGTISYAMGCGCATITTPIKYSLEMLKNNKGIIIENEQDLANNILSLLKSSKKLLMYQKNAYQFAQKMIWPKVSLEYIDTFQSAKTHRSLKWQELVSLDLPLKSLGYQKKMTTDFGIVQHSSYDDKNYGFGYSLDDQARALIVAGSLFDQKDTLEISSVLLTYFNYILNSIDDRGVIHNFFDKGFNIVDIKASPDCVARSFWALGYIKSKNISIIDQKKLDDCLNIFKNALEFRDVKSLSYALLGFCCLKDKTMAKELSDKLASVFMDMLKKSAGGWQWFEPSLTYANAIVIYALLQSYDLIQEKRYLTIAQKALSFLEKHYYIKGIPSPVGNSWLSWGDFVSCYDQQPIEAADMIIMYNKLFDITGQQKFRTKAKDWLGWYYGNNVDNINIIDNEDGGVYDGLTPNGINQNKGAESIVTFLLAHLSFNNRI